MIIILYSPLAPAQKNNYWGRGNCARNCDWAAVEGAPWGDGQRPPNEAEYKLDMSRLGTLNRSPSG